MHEFALYPLRLLPQGGVLDLDLVAGMDRPSQFLLLAPAVQQ